MRVNKMLNVVVLGMVLTIAASALRAESAIGDPPAFFAFLINSQASGQKVSGLLTLVLDLGPAPEGTSCEIFINNMSIVTVLEGPPSLTGGTKIGAFSRDFTDHRLPPGSAPLETAFCLDDLGRQIAFVLGLFREEVVPFFFGPCLPGVTCPSFELKGIKNFVPTSRGGYSVEITLAVGG